MDTNSLIVQNKIIEEVLGDYDEDFSGWGRAVYTRRTLRRADCCRVVRIGRKKASIPCIWVSSGESLAPILLGEDPSPELRELFYYYNDDLRKCNQYFFNKDICGSIFIREDLGDYITLSNNKKSYVRSISEIKGGYIYFQCRWNVKGTTIRLKRESAL